MDGTIWSIDTFTGYEGMPPVPDDLGCKYYVTDVDGWEGIVAPRVDSEARPTSDGTNDGQSTQPGKTVTITGTVRAPDIITLHQAMSRLSGLLMTGDRYDTLTCVDAWISRTMRSRRGADTLVKPNKSVYREASFSIVLYGPDARRLGAQVSTSTKLPSASGGLTVPLTVPAVISETVVSGSCSLYNPGTVAGPVTLRIDGPVTGPTVTHVSSGQQLVFASSLTLAAGEWLLVDMERHEVLANGQSQASRNQSVLPNGRGWSGFDPGQNIWTWSAAAGTTAAKLTVTATPAWA
jgi:peptidoglycan hydrolase-like protein with peptidoglycan-binding domain